MREGNDSSPYHVEVLRTFGVIASTFLLPHISQNLTRLSEMMTLEKGISLCTNTSPRE